MLRISNHRLVDPQNPDRVRFRPTDKMGAKLVACRYIVQHYTASGTMESAYQTLAKSSAKVSAHLIIDRDGTIYQLAPFDRQTWHAGASSWEGLVGLNRYSIGIENVNWGPLRHYGARWWAWPNDYGQGPNARGNATVAPSDVCHARHKHGGPDTAWQIYPKEQLQANAEVCAALLGYYGIALCDIIGHDDIAPGRKRDPGPAFNISYFLDRVGLAQVARWKYHAHNKKTAIKEIYL